MKTVTKQPTRRQSPLTKFKCERCGCEWTDDQPTVIPGAANMGAGAESACPHCGLVNEESDLLYKKVEDEPWKSGQSRGRLLNPLGE
jgi:hypothetical protein